MSELSKEKNDCHCWVPVLGTILIMLSITELGFGIIFLAVLSEMASLKEQVDSKSTSLAIAGFFRSLTGGFINLGNSSEGEAVKSIVKNLHDLNLILALGIIRVGFGGIGVLLGFLLSFRLKWSPLLTVIFSALSLILGLIGMINGADLYRFLTAGGLWIPALALGTTALTLHIIWPLFLGLRLLAARKKGVFPRW